ncbi:hypothetical protein Tco_1546759 [Tanacetum coccineum]
MVVFGMNHQPPFVVQIAFRRSFDVPINVVRKSTEGFMCITLDQNGSEAPDELPGRNPIERAQARGMHRPSFSTINRSSCKLYDIVLTSPNTILRRRVLSLGTASAGLAVGTPLADLISGAYSGQINSCGEAAPDSEYHSLWSTGDGLDRVGGLSGVWRDMGSMGSDGFLSPIVMSVEG